ncbi:hypothetical protein Phi19:1_gp078 [Cellulophaga phage phi19:1]|uniref:Uncharacterized protein n=1 Tax=Cellulophaga phage phi19:1 TaxID=1327970 RepID=R9ZZI5_9CAUD|nr:hypothetical protein Phi19:1_gp078 [Cellulophaga phage phi19:1]AGO47368.1 hypothetical protein Phi19:1_gp078 [Cellulophaga phage phi19:1]
MPYKTIQASSPEQLDEYVNMYEANHKYMEIVSFHVDETGFYSMIFYSDDVIIEFLDDEDDEE